MGRGCKNFIEELQAAGQAFGNCGETAVNYRRLRKVEPGYLD